MVFLLMFKYGKRVVQIEKWTGGGKSTLLLDNSRAVVSHLTPSPRGTVRFHA